MKALIRQWLGIDHMVITERQEFKSYLHERLSKIESYIENHVELTIKDELDYINENYDDLERKMDNFENCEDNYEFQSMQQQVSENKDAIGGINETLSKIEDTIDGGINETISKIEDTIEDFKVVMENYHEFNNTAEERINMILNDQVKNLIEKLNAITNDK